jgi:branched-subunit amino acid ABC-type transport system permease component
MMAAPIVYLDPNMMMSGILLYAFAGAVLGGIDNPWGAALGGFMVGVMENIAGARGLPQKCGKRRLASLKTRSSNAYLT